MTLFRDSGKHFLLFSPLGSHSWLEYLYLEACSSMHTEKENMKDEKKYVFDSERNVWLFIKGFFVICVALMIADFFMPKHGDNYWELVPQFYAAYGLVACIILVLGAKYVLRKLVKRDEDYYDK
jgi:hypothetical protein